MGHKGSGKIRLIRGALLYLWEEIKTMNMVKFKALCIMLNGYFRLKFTDQKKIKFPHRTQIQK